MGIMEHITKMLNSIADVRNEIEYLNNCRISAYNGFRSKNLIRLNITSNTGLMYVITYKFKTSKGGGAYSQLYQYLRKSEISH